MPKSPHKPEQKCKGCDYVGKSLRSHLSKTPKCRALYDLGSLEAEAKTLHKEQMAARNWMKYNESPAALCHLCDKSFVTKKSLDRHIEQIHLRNLEPMKCQICDKKFDYKHNLERHMTEVHGGQKR